MIARDLRPNLGEVLELRIHPGQSDRGQELAENIPDMAHFTYVHTVGAGLSAEFDGAAQMLPPGDGVVTRGFQEDPLYARFVRPDEQLFLDVPACRVVYCDSQVLRADPQAGGVKLLEFTRRAPGQTHAQFMQEVIQPVIRPEALALVNKHRDAGERIIIITATNEFVTRPIAKAFGVDDLIAVELERDAKGWFTNEISGVPTLREGKVQRLQQWLTHEGLDWAEVDATFYSDSRNDLPLLERVNHPVATNPDNTLRAVALEKGWPILELFPKQ